MARPQYLSLPSQLSMQWGEAHLARTSLPFQSLVLWFLAA